MKDKNTYKLMESLEDIETIDININDLISDEDLDSIEIDINKIKDKTYNKIGKSKPKKYKNKKAISVVASIVLLALIGTPVALAFLKQIYKYDKSSGRIIKSEVPLLVLKGPITKKIGSGEITVNSFVVNTETGKVQVEEEAKNIKGFEYYKSDIIVNDKIITDSTYNKMVSSWSGSIGTYFDYKDDSEYEYVASFKDDNDKVTEVRFDIKLEEATSVEEYNKNLPKDIKNNVVMSAITKEEENILYAEFMAIPNVGNLDFVVDNYGNHIYVLEKGTNIFLVDANGKKVEGKYVEENNANTFKFDTRDLKKPYTIEVNEIRVTNPSNVGKKVKLPRVKFGESIDYNKVINIEDENNILTSQSSNILINRIERKKLNNEDTYVLNLEFLDNKNSNIKLEHLNLISDISWFGLGKFDFNGHSQDWLTDGSKTRVKIHLGNMDVENYKPKNKTIGFEVSGSSYIIKGPWRLKINN